MVSGNWKNTNKAPGSFPRAMRDFDRVSGGAPTQKRERTGNAMAGFVILVILHAVLLWTAVRVVESAGIVEWTLGVWDSLTLSVLYVVWRSLALVSWGSLRQK